MWMNRDYDELLTFSEWIDANGSSDLYDGLEMEDDEVTQEALYEYFYYRKVVDNERFKRYFRRVLSAREDQYYRYIRIQSTDIDPVVSNYLEREVIRKDNRSSTESESGTENTGRSTRSTNTGRGSATTETSSTGTTQSSGTTNSETTESGTTSSTSSTNTKHKHGETPQSAVGSGGSMALDWTYLSSQDEDQANNTASGTTSGTSGTQGRATDTSTNTGEASTTTTDTTNGESTLSGNENRTTSGQSSKNENGYGDEHERLSGRQEAPQDLLDRARDYITNTNAFLWLVDQLDQCFMQIFDI